MDLYIYIGLLDGDYRWWMDGPIASTITKQTGLPGLLEAVKYMANAVACQAVLAPRGRFPRFHEGKKQQVPPKFKGVSGWQELPETKSLEVRIILNSLSFWYGTFPNRPRIIKDQRSWHEGVSWCLPRTSKDLRIPQILWTFWDEGKKRYTTGELT